MSTPQGRQTGDRQREVAGYMTSFLFLTAATFIISFGSRTPPAESILPPEERDPTPSATEAATLTEAEHAWATAHVQGNSQLLRPLLARDFVATDAKGVVRGMSAYMKAFPAGKTQPTRATSAPERLDIRVYGRLAVVIGQNKINGKHERFTHVYQQTQKTWQMIASQATTSKG